MDSLMEYFLHNLDQLLYAIAGFCLVLELSVLGFSGVLLFFAIACGVTGIFVSLGLITRWPFAVLSVGILSVICALVLWKPLKKFQGPAQVKDTSSDMIGQIVPVSEAVTKLGGAVRHSGINWQARLAVDATIETLDVGLRVEICAVDGNVMIVKQPSSV